tara:strand:+ start:24 stop:305 length:282 start_codon:yes stop_codon:yes gene_type:complete
VVVQVVQILHQEYQEMGNLEDQVAVVFMEVVQEEVVTHLQLVQLKAQMVELEQDLLQMVVEAVAEQLLQVQMQVQEQVLEVQEQHQKLQIHQL